MDDDTRAAMAEFATSYGDMLREELNVPYDWWFIDSPKIAKEDFQSLHEVVGDAGVRFVVMSEGPYSDEPTKKWVRYTAFYSPEAVEKVRIWYEQRI